MRAFVDVCKGAVALSDNEKIKGMSARATGEAACAGVVYVVHMADEGAGRGYVFAVL